ncbi:hypothetical protein GDN83_22695 [Gordonia jinghuaiqii]|uniref:ESX-1 secretion-associated protein n=1 Tax=Gordonia jinghuaiqii TaxID=2758710 RepID=A0A7D7R587_9ACTN|nr:hypothetical protein [Gordonia jinghuaiqii]QMT03332.1 hypothetical protein H1R19_09680 [Gordonia jinghuaiqii]
MTLPLPFPPFSLPLPRRRRETGSQDHVLGVSPAEVDATSTAWRANGIAIHALDVAAIGEVAAPSSRVARALHATADPARNAIESIGDRLIAMSEALKTFEATTTATDARAGAEFHALEER